MRTAAWLGDTVGSITPGKAADVILVRTDSYGMQPLNYPAGAIVESGAMVEWQRLPVIESLDMLLLQVFQNLISNGIKYRSAEPPRIYVSAEHQDGAWIFSVQDNGIGISPEHSEYIFGVFKRLHGRQCRPGRVPTG